MTRIRRVLLLPILLLGLAAPSMGQGGGAPLPIAPLFAQEGVPADSAEGDPLYGYIAFAFLAGFAMFAICRSSRRS